MIDSQGSKELDGDWLVGDCCLITGCLVSYCLLVDVWVGWCVLGELPAWLLDWLVGWLVGCLPWLVDGCDAWLAKHLLAGMGAHKISMGAP